jgi:hypothetical protein
VELLCRIDAEAVTAAEPVLRGGAPLHCELEEVARLMGSCVDEGVGELEGALVGDDGLRSLQAKPGGVSATRYRPS